VIDEARDATLESRLFEAVASGIVAFDSQRRIIAFNRAAAHTFGLNAEHVVGRDAGALEHGVPDLPEMLDTFFAAGASELRAEVQGRRVPDQPLMLELRMSPLSLRGGSGVAIVINDRTVQRALEDAHAAQIARTNAIELSFSRYLAPHVVRALMENPGGVTLGGVRQRATMLFADIRGFTGIASALTADRVVELLNRYFEEAVHVVFAHDGLLDKFFGDGLLALFGPPLVRDDDARRAVLTAFHLLDAVRGLNAHLDRPLAISIGLATGEVVAGHVGSAQRMDYTVIGDAVNLAAGLQQAAPAGDIYCDASTFVAAGLVLGHQPIRVRVKGRDAAVSAYRLTAAKKPYASTGT
jgi:adenylate cyclase